MEYDCESREKTLVKQMSGEMIELYDGDDQVYFATLFRLEKVHDELKTLEERIGE